MADLRTRIFIGHDAHDATAQLFMALADGSFPVMLVMGIPVMWITHHQVIPGAMQRPYYELHVTAWVKVDAVAGEEVEAIANEQR